MENKKYLHILVDSCIYLTQYRLYEVKGEEDNCYMIIDDEGDRIWVEQTGYEEHTESLEFFKVYEKYTKVRTFDSQLPEIFPENGKVYDAVLDTRQGGVVGYWLNQCHIPVNTHCIFLKEGGKWEVLGNDFKEEGSKVLDTNSTEYKIRVMQAFLDGEEIQINDSQERGWLDWGLGQPIWNWEDNSYRIKPKEELKLSIDWDQVADKYKYLAMDECGRCYLHERLPAVEEDVWEAECGSSVCTAAVFSSLVIPEGINWKESLVERPE